MVSLGELRKSWDLQSSREVLLCQMILQAAMHVVSLALVRLN